MNIRTVNEVFYSVVEKDLDRVMMSKRDGKWIPLSSREFYRRVAAVAHALESWGLIRGDRVAILSENRPEWAIADFATMLMGAATVPIYATLTPEQTVYLLRDSGARFIFVSNRTQLQKILAIKDQCAVEKIVLMDAADEAGVVPMESLLQGAPEGRDQALDDRALAIGPDEVATVMYTSGTTGRPKGAMLTQGNLASNLVHSLDLYDFKKGQVSISFLPLSHVTARHVDYAMFWHGVTIAYCPVIEQLLATLAEVKPHFFVAVPRVYEKIQSNVQSKAPTAGMKRRLYQWALRVGQEHKDKVLAGKRPASLRWLLADRLVFSKIKGALGGRVEIYISGGAPLNQDLIDWYAGLGIRIFEGYGLTETSPVIALNNPRHYRAGSVGRVLKNLEVRTAPDDEILVKGPSVFKGYWNLPAETEAAFDAGWFRTGDVGRIDQDGFLYITDRKKDLIKTSGGKFLAPQPIEAKLKANDLVAEAALVADRRRFPSVILAPNFSALEEWARVNHISFGSREELIANAQVYALYEGLVADLNRNLAQFEKIKKFVLVTDEFSIANGALTPTMKLKRRFVEERYRKELDELYSGMEPVKAS
jgi:long-chain acyl-CoA synthetase